MSWIAFRPGPYAATAFLAEQMKEIRYAALLHDFGKVGVREDVLVKAKKLYPYADRPDHAPLRLSPQGNGSTHGARKGAAASGAGPAAKPWPEFAASKRSIASARARLEAAIPGHPAGQRAHRAAEKASSIACSKSRG